ncbi:2',5' RNA ligase family [Candidatus Methanoplasma termitum]|uniref:RNA 2',3'-cyclic phosphodiesterase n=1 Tax=Candidatus Methanoplasma termitum TaxID=1577791 RepID=A0A0A7LFG0_9ARCH|nr:RNA 2',3'-cyclic phosphodiesterase [Candidatus Methanoplasma termitum]AIZ56231.1 2',5' RNA ligase family [Candidatus Methanoplasma termitum]MCL2334381.1 RNA 2',3'-cyclic phosphodiesterase [Candidatus Methanoplasma sp.]
MEKIRSFISIGIPKMPPIQDSLKELKDIRGVGVSKEIHLTLRFLGDVDASKLKKLSAHMRSLENYHNFDVSMKGIGAFPNNNSPRVVWIGSAPGEPFSSILSDLDKMLDSIGIDYDRKPFKAHITIGRVRDPSKRLTEFINENKELEVGSFVCSEIFLMKSVLTAQGAEHSVIDSFHLHKEKS